MNNEQLMELFEFFKKIDKEKLITRQTYITGGIVKENDAEHAWHAALMAILLSEYSNKNIDVLKTVTMILIYDIVEIDAGDTYAYDEAAKATQRERETKAAKRIFGILPQDKCDHLRALWEEFEQNTTDEARFAHVMDNLQPMMLNSHTGGKAWREHSVKLSQVLERNKLTAMGSNTLWEFAFDNFIKPNVEKGNIIDDIVSDNKN